MTDAGVRVIAYIVLIVVLVSNTFAQVSTTCPIAAYEGQRVVLDPKAFDPDREIGPAGRLIWTFGPPFDQYGVWQTVKGQRGIFDFWVSVSDGELTDTVDSCVDVLPFNRNPVLLPIPNITVVRGEDAKLEASCYDPDNDTVSISWKFQGNDIEYIQYEPPGKYLVTAICTDGFGGQDSENAYLTVVLPPETEEVETVPVDTVPVEQVPVEPDVEYVPVTEVVTDVVVEQPACPVYVQETVQEIEYVSPGEVVVNFTVDACPRPVVVEQPVDVVYEIDYVSPGEIVVDQAEDLCPCPVDVSYANNTYEINMTKDVVDVEVAPVIAEVTIDAPAPTQVVVEQPVKTGCLAEKGRKDSVNKVLGCNC